VQTTPRFRSRDYVQLIPCRDSRQHTSNQMLCRGGEGKAQACLRYPIGTAIGLLGLRSSGIAFRTVHVSGVPATWLGWLETVSALAVAEGQRSQRMCAPYARACANPTATCRLARVTYRLQSGCDVFAQRFLELPERLSPRAAHRYPPLNLTAVRRLEAEDRILQVEQAPVDADLTMLYQTTEVRDA
jgi:hypothetical protein